MRHLALTCLALAGCPDPSSGPPAPDSCDQPPTGIVLDSIELGTGTTEQVFVPWNDGDLVPVVFGPQGGMMIRTRLRVFGASAPECLPQESTIRDSTSATIATQSTPVHAYAQTDGSRVTRDLWIIFQTQIPLGGVTVETTSLGVTASRAIVLTE